MSFSSEAWELVGIGGNHIANQLVHRLGPDFSERYPPCMDSRDMLEILGCSVEYDMWCCWANIMRARDILEAGDANSR